MSYLTSDLITRAQRKLDDDSFDTSILIDFANDTEREVFNKYRINIMEHQYDSIVTIAGSRDISASLPTIPPPQTYISLRVILPIQYSRLLPYIDYEDADKFYPNYQLLGQGPPIAWFIFDGVPSLLNPADKVYTISAKYTINPNKLLTVGDTPNIPEEFSEITVLGMYARAMEFNDQYAEATAARQAQIQLCMAYVDATRREAGTVHTMRRPRTLNQPIMNR
jgi:hypothetical protein